MRSFLLIPMPHKNSSHKQFLNMTSFQTFYRALFSLKMFELHPPYSMNKINGKIPNKSLLTLISLVQILKGILLTLFYLCCSNPVYLLFMEG